MSECGHLVYEQLTALADGEATPIETSTAIRHLAICAECRTAYEDSMEFSAELRRAVEELELRPFPEGEASLAAAMKIAKQRRASLSWYWMAAAAAAVLLIAWAGMADRGGRQSVQRALRGENNDAPFVRLPYSTPTPSANILRVNLPLSELMEAGVVEMPPGTPNTWVPTELLLGIDGQPYAIRLANGKGR